MISNGELYEFYFLNKITFITCLIVHFVYISTINFLTLNTWTMSTIIFYDK